MTAAKHRGDKPAHPPRDAIRETLESIVIAFTLAFLVRAFEAEAFVIPTGSMAPTLMGEHKDVVCPQCSYQYTVNASQGQGVRSGECPICRFRASLEGQRTFGGDKIIVTKYPYDYADPARYDVAVFKFPGRPKTNYIKRIVGIPNETVVLYRGDVHRAPPEAIDVLALIDFRGQDAQWLRDGGGQRSRLVLGSQLHPLLADGGLEICAKPPHKILAMMQPVFDTEHQPLRLLAAGWPDRWQSDATGGTAAWSAAADYRTYHLAEPAPELVWLRYRHLPANEPIWRRTLQGGLQETDLQAARPQLITDFCTYNSNPADGGEYKGLNWAGDLILEAHVALAQRAGELCLQLVEAGEQFEVRFDLVGGDCRLSRTGDPAWQPRAVAPPLADGRTEFHVRLANVDNQVTVWVDDEVVEFDGPTAYPAPQDYAPTPLDLTPAAIGLQGTTGSLTQIRLSRDIYYVATVREGNRMDDFAVRALPHGMQPGELQAFFSTPTEWEAAYQELHAAVFPLAEGQFLALGDNSPRSADSRLWRNDAYFVPRDLLIGKAFFVFWPHGRDQIGAVNVGAPVIPYLGRMRRIH